MANQTPKTQWESDGPPLPKISTSSTEDCEHLHDRACLYHVGSRQKDLRGGVKETYVKEEKITGGSLTFHQNLQCSLKPDTTSFSLQWSTLRLVLQHWSRKWTTVETDLLPDLMKWIKFYKYKDVRTDGLLLGSFSWCLLLQVHNFYTLPCINFMCSEMVTAVILWSQKKTQNIFHWFGKRRQVAILQLHYVFPLLSQSPASSFLFSYANFVNFLKSLIINALSNDLFSIDIDHVYHKIYRFITQSC